MAQSNPSTARPLLSIRVGGPGSQPFKSVDELDWQDIPPLAVLTGVNGSGKSQLLELLAYKLANIRHPEVGDFDATRVEVTGDSFGPDSIAYLPSKWTIENAPGMATAQMSMRKREVLSQLNRENIGRDFIKTSRRARLERTAGVSSLEQLGEAGLEKIPDDFSFMLNESAVTEGLAYVFLSYRARSIARLEKGDSIEAVRTALGVPPWEILNEVLETAEFPYRVSSPMDVGPFDYYDLRLVDCETGSSIHPTDLSSGEQVLMSLVVWLYNSQHYGQFSRLLLLDEPDARLHPTLTRQYLSVVNDVLVGRFGARVIMATHSPSTVALAPNDSIFEMSRGQPRIRRSVSQASAIGVLTSGFVIVSPGTRFVLVEDADDVAFYETIREVLTDYGPNRDARAIKPAPTLVFLPASIRRAGQSIPGGRNTVISWVDKFDQPPLAEMFRGVIDRDQANTRTSRIEVLHRYSIENYLIDPFVVYGLLNEERRQPTVPGVNVSSGSEHLIRDLQNVQLQAILDTVTQLAEHALGNLSPAEVSRVSVTFTNGRVVEYPTWMLDRRGHDLLQACQSVFGGATMISPPRLRKSLQRVRLIPRELADIMDALQT